MDGQFLVAFEYYKIMPVALVVAEEQILAMGRINLLPVFEREFYGRKGRMVMCLEIYSVSAEESFHFFCLFACHDDLFLCRTKIQNFLIIFV